MSILEIAVLVVVSGTLIGICLGAGIAILNNNSKRF